MKRCFRKICSSALSLLVLISSIIVFSSDVKAYSKNEIISENMVSLARENKIKFPESGSTLEKAFDLMSPDSSEGTNNNLIYNGDFEQNPAFYGTWEAYIGAGYEVIYIWDGQVCHGNSGHAVKIQGRNVSASIVNEVSIQPEKTYSLYLWSKALKISDYEDIESQIIFAQCDDRGDIIVETIEVYRKQGSFDWTEFSYDFTAQQNAYSFFIMLSLNGSGEVWYDDVSLIDTSPLAIPVTGIALDKLSTTINTGQAEQLTATVLPENATDKSVVWSVYSQSSDNVVTVSLTGLVTAINPGTAVIRAAGNSDCSKYAECNVTVTAGTQSIFLPENVEISDTVMHPVQPVLYAVDTANSRLYAINYENKSISETGFSMKPERITFSNDKLYVTLLNLPEEQQSAAVAVLNPLDLSLIKQINIDSEPSDVVVAGDYICVTSSSNQGRYIKSYSELSKQEVSSIRQVLPTVNSEFNPVLSRIYTVTTRCSPADCYAYDLNNGYFTGSHDSPYHGDYAMWSNFRISPDGRYVFNGSGLVLTCDADKNNDLRYVTFLNKAFNDVAFNLENNRFYTAVSGGKTIYSYEYDSFEGINSYSTEGDISYLYYRDDRLIALSKINGNRYIVEEIDISGDTNIETPSAVTFMLTRDNNKIDLDYQVHDSVMHPSEPVLYLTDTSMNKIASINHETGEVKELSTFYPPGSIAYYNNELYIGFRVQGMIGIYDAQTMEPVDKIFTGAPFFDLDIGNDGFIYILSNDYTRSYSRTVKKEISELQGFSKGYLEVHPELNSLYFISTGVSPADLYVLNYSNGSLISQYDSPYHGGYAMASNNRISPDGKYIFNGSGNIFTASSEKSQNMKFYSKLNKAFNDVAFDIENNRFYTGVSDNFIYVYNYSTFQGIDTYTTQGTVKRLYLRNDELISISEQNQERDMIEFVEISPISGFFNTISINQTSPTSCTVTWETKEPATSLVEYGLTDDYGSSTPLDTALTQNHTVQIHGLRSNTSYHFKIHSTTMNEEKIVSNDIMFITQDLPSIDFGTAVSRIIFDASSNKAYAIDNINAKLFVVDLANHIIEKTKILSYKPSDLCLSDDFKKIYMVNFDGSISEYTAEALEKVRDISNTLPTFDYTNCHFHIKCKQEKLYLVDSAWAPALWTIDLNTLEAAQVTDVESIGDIVFSQNGDTFYYWHQYGWSAGWVGSYIHKYTIEGSQISAAGTSNQVYPTGMERDPLDTPIMFLENQNRLLCKTKVFKAEDLSELNTFDEDIYAVSPDGTMAAGKNAVYSLSDYEKIADTAKKSADMLMFDNNNNLYFIVNEQSRIYYDTSFSPAIAVTAVRLNKSSTVVTKGQTEQLTAEVLPPDATDKSVTWSVYSQSAADIVTVTSTGLVTAINSGTAVVRVTCTSDPAKYAECSITVAASVAGFNLDSIPNNTLKLGDDFFDMNSHAMKDPNAAIPNASLLKDGPNKNRAYFKFGGKWYAPFELTAEQFLNPLYALSDAQVAEIKGFNKWYKAGSEVVDLTIGSYSITQVNEFTATINIMINNIEGAAYFNVYKKSNSSMVNSAPIALDEGLNSMPAVFSNIDDLEVWLYSDPEGNNRIAVLKLWGNVQSGSLIY